MGAGGGRRALPRVRPAQIRIDLQRAVEENERAGGRALCVCLEYPRS